MSRAFFNCWLEIKDIVHRRDAEDAEKKDFSLAGERPAREKLAFECKYDHYTRYYSLNCK